MSEFQDIDEGGTFSKSEVGKARLEDEVRRLKQQNDRLKRALQEIKQGSTDTWAETTARKALLEADL